MQFRKFLQGSAWYGNKNRRKMLKLRCVFKFWDDDRKLYQFSLSKRRGVWGRCMHVYWNETYLDVDGVGRLEYRGIDGRYNFDRN